MLGWEKVQFEVHSPGWCPEQKWQHWKCAEVAFCQLRWPFSPLCISHLTYTALWMSWTCASWVCCGIGVIFRQASRTKVRTWSLLQCSAVCRSFTSASVMPFVAQDRSGADSETSPSAWQSNLNILNCFMRSSSFFKWSSFCFVLSWRASKYVSTVLHHPQVQACICCPLRCETVLTMSCRICLWLDHCRSC